MIRILYVHPGADPAFDPHFERLLNDHASPEMRIDVLHLDLRDGPSGPFLPSLPAYQGELFRTLARAGGQGYQAAIVGCCSDPGYRSAKRSAHIPVVFPLEAGLHLAAMLAERVSVITPGPLSEVAWIEDSARHYGLSNKICSIRIACVPYPAEGELMRAWAEDPGRAATSVIEAHHESIHGDVCAQARIALDEQGARAIFLACTFWGGMAASLEDRLGVPVIDPVLAPLALAELLARRGR